MATMRRMRLKIIRSRRKKQSMIGAKRMLQLQRASEFVIERGVPGDFVPLALELAEPASVRAAVATLTGQDLGTEPGRLLLRAGEIDAAIFEFRTGTDALIVKRKSAMQLARDAFKTSVTTALTKVETDCANGVPTATILSSFKTSLESTRTTLANDKKAAESMRGDMKKMADTRKASVAAALKTFQAELLAANAELEKAFEE